MFSKIWFINDFTRLLCYHHPSLLPNSRVVNKSFRLCLISQMCFLSRSRDKTLQRVRAIFTSCFECLDLGNFHSLKSSTYKSNINSIHHLFVKQYQTKTIFLHANHVAEPPISGAHKKIIRWSSIVWILVFSQQQTIFLSK